MSPMIRSHTAAALAAIGIASLLPGPAAAQEPTRVAVSFELLDARFRARFGPDTTAVHARLANLLGNRLGQRIGFVRFVSGGTAPYRLTFSLDRRDRLSTGQFAERGVWVTLAHPEGDTAAYWFTLRDASASAQAVGSAAELEREIDTALGHQDYELIRVLLARVPIAREALPRQSPPGWALPFKRDSLCIRNESALRIMNREQVGGVTLVQPYDATVRGELTSNPGQPHQRYHLGVFGVARQPVQAGEVTEVYVTHYLHLPNCGLQLAAPPIDPNGGGAP